MVFTEEKFKVEDFQELIDLVKEDSIGEYDVYTHFNRLFIRNMESNTELMVRYGRGDSFIIASISLENGRQGLGTQILEWCIRFALANNFSFIEYESVLSESMTNFVKKHQFEKREKSENWYKKIV